MNTPAYGTPACDHEGRKASLDAFAQMTVRHCMQSDGEDGWLLLGNCTVCHTTLAVPIALARGHVVHGEIATSSITKAEQHILDEIARHGNIHHYATPELRAHVRALAYRCPTCGALPTFSCSNDDPLANNCPARQAFVAPESAETTEEHARRVIR